MINLMRRNQEDNSQFHFQGLSPLYPLVSEDDERNGMMRMMSTPSITRAITIKYEGKQHIKNDQSRTRQSVRY